MWKKLLIYVFVFLQTNIVYAFEYDEAAQNLLIEKVQHRKPRTEADLKAKIKILQEFPELDNSGDFYKSPNFAISYVSEADVFQVEIKTIAIDLAKEEAVYWFLNHGFSPETICNYPVTFYLNGE